MIRIETKMPEFQKCLLCGVIINKIGEIEHINGIRHRKWIKKYPDMYPIFEPVTEYHNIRSQRNKHSSVHNLPNIQLPTTHNRVWCLLCDVEVTSNSWAEHICGKRHKIYKNISPNAEEYKIYNPIKKKSTWFWNSPPYNINQTYKSYNPEFSMEEMDAMILEQVIRDSYEQTPIKEGKQEVEE